MSDYNVSVRVVDYSPTFTVRYRFNIWSHSVHRRRVCRVICQLSDPSNSAHSSLSSIKVKDQAFIDATVASNPIINYGVSGIVGLGFTKLSTIDGALQKAGINDGKSLLYNLFLENPDEPNFIAFALQRTVEHAGDVEGSFTVGTPSPVSFVPPSGVRLTTRSRRI